MLEKGYVHGQERPMKNQGGNTKQPGFSHMSASPAATFLKDAQPLFQLILYSISFPHRMPPRVSADFRQFVSSVYSSVDLYLEPA